MAGFLSDSSLIILSIIFCFYAFKKNIDPDNIIIPSITTISDFISILFLFLSVNIINFIL